MHSRSPLPRSIRALLGVGVGVGLVAGLELALSASGVAPETLEPSPFGAHWSHPSYVEPAGDGWLSGCGGGTPRPCLAEAPGLRVSVYGGSAIEGLPFSVAGAIPHQLERLLVRVVDTPVEVLNHGNAGHALRQVRHRAIRNTRLTRPDLVIIASGNNEFWEVAAHKRADSGWSARSARAGLFLRRLATYRLLLGRLRPAPETAERDALTLQDDHLAPMTDADRAFVEARYRHHLERLVDELGDQGVPLMLTTVADDQHYIADASDLPDISWQAAALRAARDDDAIDEFLADMRAVERDHRVYYALAEHALDGGDAEVAAALFEEAEYRAPNPHRSNRVLRDIVREVAAAEGVPLCDVAEELRAHAEHGIPGPDLFYDWCHYNAHGNRVVAGILLRCMAWEGLGLPQGTDVDPANAALSRLPDAPEPAPSVRLDRAPATSFRNSGPPVDRSVDCTGRAVCDGYVAFAARDWDGAKAAWARAADQGEPAGALAVNRAWTRLMARDPARSRAEVETALDLLGPDAELENMRRWLGGD